MFAFGTVQAMTFPFMAIYFARSMGETITGVLLTLSVVASMFSSALGGYYADKIGRKRLMVFSEAVFLLAYLVMAFANSPWLNSPMLTFVAFFVTNVCWGVYGPADEAMLLDVTTVENRQLMYAIFYWITNLTMAVGASIGAFLFDSFRFFLFAAMAIVILGTLLTTVFLIEETYIPHPYNPYPDAQDGGEVRLENGSLRPGRGVNIIHNYIAVLKDGPFVRYVLAGMLVMAVEFQLSNYIGIRLSQTVPKQSLFQFQQFVLHIDGVKLLGFLQTENTVLVVLFAGLAARVASRFSDKKVLTLGILPNVIGYSVMTVTSQPFLLMIAMLFATIGEVTAVPVRQAYLGDLAPSTARSSYVAVNGMTFSASRVLSSLGVMLGAVAPSWMVGLVSLTVGVTGLLLYHSVVSPALARRELPEPSITT